MAKSSKRKPVKSRAIAKLTGNLEVAAKSPEAKLRDAEKRAFEKARKHARIAAAKKAEFEAGLVRIFKRPTHFLLPRRRPLTAAQAIKPSLVASRLRRRRWWGSSTDAPPSPLSNKKAR